MELNLKKPILFFDIESTGLNIIKDRIIEISYIKVNPNGSEEERTRRVNPEMPIPPESTAIHGITDADVADKPTFKEIAKELARELEGCDLAGYNSDRFDVPILVEEMLRAEVEFDVSRRQRIDVQTIFHKMEQRTLIAAYKFYCNMELENAHSATADTKATYEVLKAQLDRYPQLENDVKYLAKFSTQQRGVDLSAKIVLNSKDEEVFNFGKHKGVRVVDIFEKEPSYYDWMMKGEFPLDTKRVITAIKLKSKFK